VAALPLARLPREEAATLGILFAALIVSLLPANQEIHKATWLVLALLVIRCPLLLRSPQMPQEVRHGSVS